MLQYYPQSAFPSLKQLNSEGAWNKYAGWKGDGAVGANSKVLTGPDVVERGWTEVERRWEVRKKVDPETKEVEETWREAGWLEDDYERQRVAKVAFRRLLGKGPPKKGECGDALFGDWFRLCLVVNVAVVLPVVVVVIVVGVVLAATVGTPVEVRSLLYCRRMNREGDALDRMSGSVLVSLIWI
jgi:hypothetical protein